MPAHNWHQQHRDDRPFGARLADQIAKGMGSWPFIIGQSLFIVAWMILNTVAFIQHWDPVPYIMLNLVFSTQAAYAAPIIMMSQNRASERDRVQAQNDYDTNVQANEGVTLLLKIAQDQVTEIKALRELLARDQRHEAN